MKTKKYYSKGKNGRRDFLKAKHEKREKKSLLKDYKQVYMHSSTKTANTQY
jgi:hypothetical protein